MITCIQCNKISGDSDAICYHLLRVNLPCTCN